MTNETAPTRLLLLAAVAAGAGALSVLSLPPFSYLLAVPLAFSTLFLILRRRTTGKAFLVGWAFGLGQFAFGVSWIAESFYVDGDQFGALARKRDADHLLPLLI